MATPVSSTTKSTSRVYESPAPGPNVLVTLRNFLSGKKTFILGTLMFLISLEKYFTGDTTFSQFLTTVQGIVGFNGLGFITLRYALAKIQKV